MSKKLFLIIFAAVIHKVIRTAVVAVLLFYFLSGRVSNNPLSFFSADTSAYSESYKNVKIITYTEKDMFPSSWWESPENGKVEPLSKSNRIRGLADLRKALDKYSMNVLDENLKKVYLLGDMQFFGYGYGGTYYGSTVFLVVKSGFTGYTDAFIEKSFHHEFSSILFYRYDSNFDENKWIAANAADFKYGNGGIEALKNGNTSLDFDEECNKMGLLNEYSKASVEEDFNEIAGNVFLSSAKFWDIVDKYEGVKKKVNLVIEFYNKIDPIYTEQYFRGFSKEQ